MKLRILVLAVWAAACGKLERIGLDGTCGNRIVEPDVNEDCDGSAPFDYRCGLPAEAHRACRFVCSETRCPPGWVCGEDGVCRVPRGTFEPIDLEVRGVSTAAIRANLNKDAYDDLVRLTGTEVQVHYGDPSAELEEVTTFSVDKPLGDLESGDFDGDGYSDLAIEQLAGPLFLRGREDKVLEQIAHPAFARTIDSGLSVNGAPQTRFLAVETGMGLALRSPVLLQNRTDEVSVELPFDSLLKAPLPLSLPPDARGPLPLAIAVGEIDSSTISFDEIALGLEGTRTVIVFSVACRLKLVPELHLACDPEVRATVSTSSPIQGGTFFADVSGDGHQDLIVHVDGGFELAFGDGAGGFSRSAPFLIEVEGESFTGLPSHAGELGFTDRPDFVFARGVEAPGRTVVFGLDLKLRDGVYVLESLESYVFFGRDAWSQVATGDINRDGAVDLIGVRTEVPGLDVLLGTSSPLFNPFNVRFEQPIERIAVGDFNGDFYDDVVAYEETGGLWVVYGSPEGPGEQSYQIRSGPVVDLVPVDTISAQGFDLIRDLVVVTDVSTGATPSYGITLLLGSSDRQMLAPLSFVVDGKAQQQSVLDAVVGRFSADEYDDLVIVSTTDSITAEQVDIELWLLQGDATSSGLPRSLQLESCPLSSACIAPTPPTVANLDLDDEEEVLVAATCPASSLWIADIDATRAESSCRRADGLEQTGEAQLVPVDVDLDGPHEIAIYGPSSTKLARTSDGSSWTVEELVFAGDPPRHLTPMPGGPPHANLAFVSGDTIYLGALVGSAILEGVAIGIYPFAQEPASGDGPPSQITLTDYGALLQIDARGDRIPDLVVLGRTLLIQQECLASDDECSRPEVVE